MARRSRATTLNLVAVGIAAATAMLLALMPVYEVDGGGSETLIEHEGWGVIAVLVAPALVAGVPLLLPHRHRHMSRVAVATVLVLLVIATGFTVGLLFLPTAVLMVLAARRPAG